MTRTILSFSRGSTFSLRAWAPPPARLLSACALRNSSRLSLAAVADAYSPPWASSSARSSARALSHVSSYSAAGFESMTTPAPACT